MGKPFNKELDQVLDTFMWAIQQSVETFRDEILSNRKLPLFIVGSGGSLSACYYGALLYQQYGLMAKPVTPLELIYSKQSLRNSNILFISASGKNTDILLSYRTAISYEPNKVYNLCMKVNTPLAKLAAKNSISKSFEYSNPAGKDGFLATNSLVAFFSILYKTLSPSTYIAEDRIEINESFLSEIDLFITKVSADFTFTILHAGWGQSVAMDIESKLAEASLGDVLISDYRNFGHGRHHWFDKRIQNSAIIALVTPEEDKLASKTLALLPVSIPVLKIISTVIGPLGSIDLLIKSFHFIKKIGELQAIDPGRPGVPDFGSKLYHLNYQKFYAPAPDFVSEDVKMAIVRKADVPSFNSLTQNDKSYWLKAYESFTNKLKSTEFGSIVFDYDGTICSAENRYHGIDDPTAKYLINFLRQGVIIGIATGRGQSVRNDLQKSIPEEFWDQIIIGYYNCSDFGLASENNLPDKSIQRNEKLERIFNELMSHQFVSKIIPELKPHQIVVEIKDKLEWNKVRLSVIQFVISLNISGIQVLESSHSLDIIDQNVTNKLNIIPRCIERTNLKELAPNCLCLGDKGKWPGNDYQLLSWQYSLSVDEVSSLSESCWNLSKPGVKNLEATLNYLSCLTFKEKGLIFNIA